jgi:outer membrane protein assembly factor BamB
VKDFKYSPHGWDMFRNSTDGSAADASLRDVNTLLWSRKLKARVYATPVVNNGLGVIPGLDKRIYLFDPENGKGIGRIKTKSSSSSSPAICENLLYIASEKGDGRLRCINLTNGLLVWERKLGDLSAPLILHDRSLLVGNYGGEFYSINRFTGETEWSFSTDGPIKGGAAVLEDRVLIGSAYGKLYCLNFATGDLNWSFETDGAVYSSPAVDTTACYVTSFGGVMHAVDLASGEELWRFETSANVFGSPVIDQSAVYFGANDGGFYALSKRDGSLIWTFQTETIISSTPLVGRDAVLFGAGDGMVYVLDKIDGGLLFEYHTGSRIKSSPVLYDGKVYVVTTEKKLFCFGSQPKSADNRATSANSAE